MGRPAHQPAGDLVTPRLLDALAKSSQRDRNLLVMVLMSRTGDDSNLPDYWRACADLVSKYEPGMTATNVEDPFVTACSTVSADTLYRIARRMASMEDDPIMCALGHETEGARMVLIQLDHAVKEAMRPRWPDDDGEMSAS